MIPAMTPTAPTSPPSTTSALDPAGHPNLVQFLPKKHELPPPSFKRLPNYVQELNLTENQSKVIKDKYLKDSPTPQHWMYTICHNIALAEFLYVSGVDRAKIFDGIQVAIDEDRPTQDTRSVGFYLHRGNYHYDRRISNFRKFMHNLYALAETPEGQKVIADIERRFYRMLSNFDFLPNSPTLMNAGRALQQLSACYVLPVGDSIEEIYESLKNMALIHKSGGGTGFSFSRLRPANDEVLTTRGISSGPVSFMSIFDKSTDVVKQGGTRRGANMGIMQYDHPDIMTFITCKKQAGFLENFNISVAITEDFMRKVERNEDYDMINPHTGEKAGTMNAKELFDFMVKSAWETGDPGFVVIDRINNSDSNPTPAQGMIESTNPCGEQPLLPYEPCNLGSINLSRFVTQKGAKEGAKAIDYERLRETVHLAVHFLDNVIDVNNYPIPEIEEMAKRNRRIGLGVMGWAEMIANVGIPYNSEEGFALAEKVMKFINDEALIESERLAKERGVFPGYKDCIYDRSGKHFRGQDVRPRHSARTTIAPTGTIGITAGLQGAGIEPFFAISYVRYNAAGIDALKKGETPKPENTFWEVNPVFREVAKQHNFFGLCEEDLWKKIEQNHKSVVGIPDVPKDIQNIFLTAHDLTPIDHVRIQCAFQKYTNNAVSKTVNLRNESTPQDVHEVYMLAFKNGAKGVTIYRDGSKTQQILNLTDKKAQATQPSQTQVSPAPIASAPMRRGSDMGERSAYYSVETGYGKLHMHVNYDDEGPVKLFINISPTGTEISGLTTALGIISSKYLEQGGDPSRLIKHLNSIKGDRPYGFGPKRVDSIPHGIAKVLRDHLVRTGKLHEEHGQLTLSLPNGNHQGQNQHTQTAQTQAQALPAQEPAAPALPHHAADGDQDHQETGDAHHQEKAEKAQQNPHDALFCPKCFSSNVEIMAGCSEPTCFDCGYSKCG